ncbi:MAG TPA: LysM peptidoglycan-binding domain-containing protein [Chryseosolibacter sp.]|nr:LysM peptidoglycan-binding domain-containing protein [Chryseosolibacter sp.]
MRILTALFFAVTFFAAAQTPQVPHKMSFAGMTLTIRDDARRLIQKDVDALTQSPKHFNIKADRARTYFPIIEQIFKEESVPDDFKYLVLQESALIADAVSVSNAVGFWQFKDFTAMEMGLRVDKEIDERMNIASSTRAAAQYIKKNNTFFDNWLYALQAYQMGAGGVMRSEKNTHNGKKDAVITSDTYWYVRKYLAYKIAYEPAMRGKGQIELVAFKTDNGQQLRDIAKQFSVSEEELRSYNKWALKGDIPNDKAYTIVVPNSTGIALSSDNIFLTSSQQPISQQTIVYSNVVQEINSVKAVQALPGETTKELAERVRVDLASFLRWNEINYKTPLVPGMYYFIGKKKGRAAQDYYTVNAGESLWFVSQKFGVRVKKLIRFNRLESEILTAGTTLWLSHRKPKSGNANPPVPVEEKKEETIQWADDNAVVQTSTNVETDSVLSDQGLKDTLAVAAVNDSTGNIETAQTLADPVATDTVAIASTNETNGVPTEPTTGFPTPVKQVNANNEHVVQPKETLYGIAKVYEVKVMDLVQWNNLDIQQGLRIGQILKVKGETSKDEPVAKIEEVVSTENSAFHEVKATDTLYSIARQYNVTIKELMDLNEKKDFTLSVGEKLRVKAQ